VNVPEGRLGDWSVERFEVSEEGAAFWNLRQYVNPQRGLRLISPGTYTRLTRGKTLVMSDTPSEVQDHLEAIGRAEGAVLIHGLGLGMVASACLDKPEVDHVTIVENSPDVIGLVGPWLKERYGDRVEIIEADARTWKPPTGARWDMVWHDIWDDLCTDNLPEMHTLHRRFGRRSKWQGSWSRDFVEALG